MLLFDMLQSPQNFWLGGIILFVSAGVLMLVAAFRSTITNLIFFLIGGAAGLLTCISSFNRLLAALPNPLNEHLATVGSIVVMLLGALVGGSLTVWIKVRLTESPQRKRWSLPIAQLMLSFAMVQQVLFFGLLGTLGALGMTVTGHFNTDLAHPRTLYDWGLWVASFSLDFALLFSSVAAALAISRPSRLSARVWIAGTFCYWSFIAGEMLLRWSLHESLHDHLTLRYVRISDLTPYIIGTLALLVARSFYSYVENIQPRLEFD